ncbi:MAG TPA: trypsin-like peptidase domain-containing protein [Candidatus Limnocylindrales bacterium]
MTDPQAVPSNSRWPWSPRLRRVRERARVRSRIRGSAKFGAGIAAALIAVFIYGALNPAPRQLDHQDVATDISHALASLTPAPAFAQTAYQAIQPSLVLIVALPAGSTPGASASASPGASILPEPSPSAAGVSTADGTQGSGVIMDKSGNVMTCLHVVAGASTIELTFADGTTSTAQISTSDAATDIAVLKPDHPPATIVPAVFGSSRSLQVGSDAYVVGNPFGLAGSISAGVVSGLDRSFTLAGGTQLTGLIQVDAAVNPGSSGGPLVNRYGQVVGIVAALINPTSQGVFIGIGLVVPLSAAGGAGGLPLD